MSMITPSPNAGCSTSSPTRSPISARSTATARLARRRRERRVDDPLAMAVGLVARRRTSLAVAGTAAGRRRTSPAAASSAGRRLRPLTLPFCSTSSAGISSRNRDGGLYWVRAEQPAAPGVGEVQPLAGPGDADVGQPALLLQLVGLGRARACGGRRPPPCRRGTRPGTRGPWPSAASSARPTSRRRRARRCRPPARPARGTRRRA